MQLKNLQEISAIAAPTKWFDFFSQVFFVWANERTGQKIMNTKKVMFSDEFAKTYGVSLSHVRKKCAEGDLDYFPVKPEKRFGR